MKNFIFINLVLCFFAQAFGDVLCTQGKDYYFHIISKTVMAERINEIFGIAKGNKNQRKPMPEFVVDFRMIDYTIKPATPGGPVNRITLDEKGAKIVFNPDNVLARIPGKLDFKANDAKDILRANVNIKGKVFNMECKKQAAGFGPKK